MSTSSRQPPTAGIRARLLNRGAYQWYLGTLFGLAYQAYEIVYIWTSDGSVGFRIVATVVLSVFYVGYVLGPPLLWPQSVRARILGISVYWVATFALLPFLGAFVIWVWPLVVAMIAFSWLPWLPSLVMAAVIAGVQLLVAAEDRRADGIGFAPFVTVTVAVSLFSITTQIQANRKLRDAQATIASLAAADERARLARDLHDVLGHSLTVVAVKSELAGRLVDRDPTQAIAEISDIETLARTALTDLRAAVSSYRDMNLDSEIAAARTALEAAGIRSHLPADGSAGHRVVDPALAAESLAAGPSPLSRRETDVLVAVRQGSSSSEVAQQLHLSEGTVRNHLSAAIGKTGARNAAEAARVAAENGWLLA